LLILLTGVLKKASGYWGETNIPVSKGLFLKQRPGDERNDLALNEYPAANASDRKKHF